MIKKVRWRFITITMIAISFLMVIIVLITNSINYYSVTKSADETLDFLAENGGKYPRLDPPEEESDSSGNGMGGSDSESGPKENPGGKEGPYSTRYFTVTFDSGGNITASNTAFIKSFTKQEAQKLAKEIYNTKETRGYINSIYRYLKSEQDNSATMILVLDYSLQLTPLENFRKVSLIVIGCGIVVAFPIVYFLSGLTVNSLVESDKKQKQFITNAGHEMKTPLTIISANNEIIEMEYGESDSTKSISKEVARMNEMVRNLTSLAKIDEMSKPVFTKISLTDEAEDAISTFRPLFEKEEKKLIAEIEDSIFVKADESMIRKLLSILLDNARKYSLTETHFTLKRVNGKAEMEVYNDATGVENGNLNKVFDRFYRSTQARGSGIEGSGIGLAIAYQISQKNRFRIQAFGTDQKYFHILATFSLASPVKDALQK